MALKDINCITSLCGKGLEREYHLLKSLLAEHDCYTNGIHYTAWENSPLVRADINVFFEVIHPLAFSLSRENWLFPNCEWWDARNDQFLHKFTRICCKTKDCERIWKAKLANSQPSRVIYTGFESRDLYRPEIPRENKFLHLAGESEWKNTEAVIEAWRTNNWSIRRVPLTVVTRQQKYQDLCAGLEDVTCLGRVTEEELVQLLNSHRFHIMPSAYEGYGHALHEGIGVGALVITTDAAPMNEFAGVQRDWSVKVLNKEPRALAQVSRVNWIGVITAACKALTCSENVSELEHRSRQAREAFLSERADFRRRLLELVGVK